MNEEQAQAKREKHNSDKMWLDQILVAAQGRRYFGTFSIIMEDGEIRRIKKEESLMPPVPR
jgi:hypothetical protein